MSQLTNQRLLATFMWLTDDRAIYWYGDEDAPFYFPMDKEAWEDMGKPAEVTLDITPGDLLN